MDSTKIIAAAQEQIDIALAQDAVNDAAERQAQAAAYAQQLADALAADAVQDAAALKVKDDAYTALQAQFDAYKASHPDAPAPPPVVVPPPPPPPVSTGFPDATNTGPKGALTAYAGSMTISKAGTVIDSKKIAGTLTVTAANVIIRNCQIDFDNYWGIDGGGASGMQVLDCKITGKGNSGNNTGVLTGAAGVVKRCNISMVENGIVMQNGACVAEDNYIHDLKAGPEGHYDCISVQGGQVNAVIRHNTLIGWDTSAVIIKCDFGPISGTLVENNLMKNQSSSQKFAYPVYSVKGNAGSTPTGTKVINNVIEKGAYGGYFSFEGTVTKQGNLDYVTGAPAN